MPTSINSTASQKLFLSQPKKKKMDCHNTKGFSLFKNKTKNLLDIFGMHDIIGRPSVNYISVLALN